MTKKKEIPVRCSITSQMLVKAQVPPPNFVDAQNQNTVKNSKCDTLFTLLFPCAVISFAVNHVIHPIFRLFFVCLLVVCFYSGKCYSKLQCSYHKKRWIEWGHKDVFSSIFFSYIIFTTSVESKSIELLSSWITKSNCRFGFFWTRTF